MNLEDRLDEAKKDKLLTKAPALRRVILRSRWFGTIGGIFMVISAVRNLNKSSLDDPSPVVTVISILGILFAVAILAISQRIARAADARDLAETKKLLKSLRGILIFGLICSLGSGLYAFVALSEGGGGGGAALVILLFMLVPIAVIGAWIREVARANEEIEALEVGEGR